MLTPKKKLSIQIGHINRIQINNLDVAETAESEIFEELAANTARADEEDAA